MQHAIAYVTDGEHRALVPSGFIYRGRFYGRARTQEGWIAVKLRMSELTQLLENHKQSQ